MSDKFSIYVKLQNLLDRPQRFLPFIRPQVRKDPSSVFQASIDYYYKFRVTPLVEKLHEPFETDSFACFDPQSSPSPILKDEQIPTLKPLEVYNERIFYHGAENRTQPRLNLSFNILGKAKNAKGKMLADVMPKHVPIRYRFELIAAFENDDPTITNFVSGQAISSPVYLTFKF